MTIFEIIVDTHGKLVVLLLYRLVKVYFKLFILTVLIVVVYLLQIDHIVNITKNNF